MTLPCDVAISVSDFDLSEITRSCRALSSPEFSLFKPFNTAGCSSQSSLFSSSLDPSSSSLSMSTSTNDGSSAALRADDDDDERQGWPDWCGDVHAVHVQMTDTPVLSSKSSILQLLISRNATRGRVCSPIATLLRRPDARTLFRGQVTTL